MAHPTLYFVRHGQTDWNVALRLQGQQDIPINSTGRAQATQNGRRLAGLLDDPARFRYIASPLGRTRETMNLIRLELGLPAHGYETDDRIKEIAFGLWETYTFDELRVDNAEAVAAREADKWNYAPPLGESYARLLARVQAWLPYVREDSVIVCHGGILRVLEHHLNGTPTDEVAQISIPQDNIYVWDGYKARWLD
ncbi:histidine phosphatase family protein [Pseudahrensia aquimaris]|uniref:Histidine phosphatase family protein n=1 Tax=Pseudahrensia aquimaris TaxID=744461 RepID=A0ABW3FE14_9HYPH